jgi:hypothetical protein
MSPVSTGWPWPQIWGRLFASATDQNRVVAIDLATLKVVGGAPTGSYPDGVAYAPEARSVFVSDEHGSGDTVVDARSSEHLGEVELGGDIGNTVTRVLKDGVAAQVEIQAGPFRLVSLITANTPGASPNSSAASL